MPTAENAILYYEAGQDPVAMVALVDDGDHQKFNSSDELWSNRSGYEPDVKPNGLATGGVVTPAVSGTNNKIDVAALTCYLAGVLTEVSASPDETIARATPTDTHVINSVTITSAGAVAIVTGTDGTSFSETRGAAGGPPWIPTGSIEIAQVRLSSNVDAAVAASEIKAVPGTHKEMYNFPVWETHRSRVENNQLGYAGVTFASVLPQIHSDDAGSTTATKKVYAAYFTPSFAQVPECADFVRPAESHSVNSTQIYGGTKGSSSKSLGQGSFNAFLQDGVTDNLLQFEGSCLFFKFKPDRLKTPYVLCQGILGVSETFPAGDNIQASCTISADDAGVRLSS